MLSAAIVLAAFASPVRADGGGEAVKVFILAGQSNMEGYGGERTLDPPGALPAEAELLKKIRKEDGSYVVRDDVLVYYQRREELIRGPLTFGQGAHKDRLGPELGFGISMGDHFQEPVLLIKTAWGGKDLYCDFRPPGAGAPPYAIPGAPREPGAFYRKMVEEIRQCLGGLDTHFPQLKGRAVELCGFVWFQGWNDMCAPREIKQRVFDEYASNFAHLVQDLRTELKTPGLPVVVGEVGVGGENVRPDSDMGRLRAAQARIRTRPELDGTLGYVRSAPFWYPELDELPRKLHAEEQRIRKPIKAELQARLEGVDPKEIEKRVDAAARKALAADPAYQAVKAEHDKHVSHWECHYQGSSRVYALIGRQFAEAMKGLLRQG